MTPERAQQLDAWLAAREITGERFGTRAYRCEHTGKMCFVGSYLHDQGFEVPAGSTILGWTRAMLEAEGEIRPHGFERWASNPLIETNDASEGDPTAIRAKLHELYPFLTETPVRSSPAPTHTAGYPEGAAR